MHYFKRNIGDYHKKAGRLTMVEHGAYTLLMDACYDRERFPTEEEAIDWCWARTDEEIAAVRFVLRKFFTLEGGHYVQQRIADEIEVYREKSSRNKRIALEREARRRAKREPNEHVSCSSGDEPPPNQEPLTTNHKPIQEGEESPRSPHCPHQKIVELYHQTLTAMPQVRVMTEARKRQLASLWKQHPNLQWWSDYFLYCSQSDFLCGRADGKPGKPPFVADLEWITKPSNHAKIVEGKYHQRGAA